MRTIKTQFGRAACADFEENTWTFEMPDNYKVWAGEFAIVDKPVYDEILQALSDAPILSKYNKAEDFIKAYEEWRDNVKIPAIKKATE